MNQEFYYNETLSFKSFLSRTFMVTAGGLAITTLTSWIITNFFFRYIMLHPAIIMVSCIAELVVVFVLSGRIRTLSKSNAITCFIMYSILNGISLSTLLAAYTTASVTLAFATTTILFVCMSMIGHNSKVDLTKFGGLLLGGMIALLIGSIILMFIPGGMASWSLCAFGIILFLALIAYDVQKLRYFYSESFSDSEMADKMVIFGALELYLDFINLFIRVLQMFGRRRD